MVQSGSTKGSFTEDKHLLARQWAGSLPRSFSSVLAVVLQMCEVWEKGNEDITFPESTVCQGWDSNPDIRDP